MGKSSQVKVKVLSNKNIKNSYWHMRLDAKGISSLCLPGQFISIKLGDNSQPLLRRPFSIHGVCLNSIEILYEVLGEGTRLLSGQKKGDVLDVIGPLGNGFELVKQQSIIVAGGMGVAPLAFLAQKLKVAPLVIIGARAKDGILCEKEFKKLGCDVKIATDDGSAGFKGRVTDLLQDILRKTHNTKYITLYACGPKLMLREIARVCSGNKISGQLSLEAHMACGIGACLGCVVKTSDGFKRVCKDGPVFTSQEIIW